MQLGMIGLGRMGANMVRRLSRAGHDCVVYDVSAPAVQALAREGATGAASLAAFVQALARRAPSGASTRSTSGAWSWARRSPAGSRRSSRAGRSPRSGTTAPPMP